jgi:hypothetical protein
MKTEDVVRVIDSIHGTDDTVILEKLLSRIFAQWPGDSDVQLLATRIRRKIELLRRPPGATEA